MIFHLSVEADHPCQLAEGLAEIMGGEAFPFPPVGEGSWVALEGDAFGSMIEVYARGTNLHQSEDGAVGLREEPRRHGATHFAIGTTLNTGEVLAITDRYGWTAKYCRRADRFGLIEVWVDDCLMFEVLTEPMQREYLDTITIENYRRMLDEMPARVPVAA